MVNNQHPAGSHFETIWIGEHAIGRVILKPYPLKLIQNTLMSSQNRWLLPAGIEEVLPENARIIESYRRKCLDLFSVWGYQLVIPPLIEFLDSLLIGDCHDLDLQTFKVTDQMSGRSMGIHADMTPQVARIEAHRLNSDAPTRLCYCGTVLHTLPEGAGGSRSPIQIGAELYGHTGQASDIEIITLMEATLQTCGTQTTLIDLGHTGILEALLSQLDLSAESHTELDSIMQRKSTPDMVELLAQIDCNNELKTALVNLISLHGKYDVLERARQQLSIGGPEVLQHIDYLQDLSQALTPRLAISKLHYDLTETRGYHYQHGVVFTAFCPTLGQELARGGRYDNIGESFGRARPATGFSSDLKQLLKTATPNSAVTDQDIIFAPASADPDLHNMVNQLRDQGHIVVTGLDTAAQSIESSNCAKILVNVDNQWIIKDK